MFALFRSREHTQPSSGRVATVGVVVMVMVMMMRTVVVDCPAPSHNAMRLCWLQVEKHGSAETIVFLDVDVLVPLLGEVTGA